jgi:phosphocarrier protein HPr
MGLLNRRSATGSGEKAEKEIVIVNRLGLHARPSAMFVRVSSRFRCEIWVSKGDDEINGKSIMGLMMLAAGQGSKLRLRAEGPDAAEAIQEIEKLIESRFSEE